MRLTRLNKGETSRFEDRGNLEEASGSVKGTTGFGGGLTGILLKNNGMFLEGKGGSVDFVLVATQTAKDHYRCFRRLEAHRPVQLWGTNVQAETFYVTTEDQLLETADKPPADVRQPLESAALLAA